MSRRTRSAGPPFSVVTILVLALTACGDDTVNPSNPDAGASKAATTLDSGHDGSFQDNSAETGAVGIDSDDSTSDAPTLEAGDDGGF
jgi:hypothetical protein